MKAVVIAAPGRVEVVERELPEPTPGWVRLATGAVGICGSDLHLFRGHVMNAVGLQPGHEVAGTVDAVGEGVDVAIGTTVAVEPIHACGECLDCRTGFHNRCEQSKLFGISARGGMAEFFTVPAHCLHVVPRDLDMNTAALSEPIAVAVRAMRLGRVGIGRRIAVLGAGSIGLACVLAARDAGAEEIFVTARYPHQAEFARVLGATGVFDDGSTLRKACGAVDAVIETVGGTADTLTEAVTAVRRGGTIVMVGVFDGSPRLPGLPFMAGEITLVGSNCYAHDASIGDFALATRLVARHREALAPFVTHRFALDEIDKAYAAAGDKHAGAVKVQIDVG